MELSTLLGIIIGIFTIVVGLVLKGASVGSLANPAAFVIIFVGTAAALLNAFPMKEFAQLPAMFKEIFRKNNQEDKKQIAREFVSMAQIVRRDGLMVLEQKAETMTNAFMGSGISMVVDGIEPHIIDEVLESRIEAMKDRHKLGAALFSQAGTYAPTLGVMGAVIGLIAALGNLNDIDKLGHSIAAAFVATMFGIFTGYVLWHPFSHKLKRRSQDEVELRRMIVQGILALQAGDPPVVMQFKMLAYLGDKDKKDLEKEWAK